MRDDIGFGSQAEEDEQHQTCGDAGQQVPSSIGSNTPQIRGLAGKNTKAAHHHAGRAEAVSRAFHQYALNSVCNRSCDVGTEQTSPRAETSQNRAEQKTTHGGVAGKVSPVGMQPDRREDSPPLALMHSANGQISSAFEII